MTRFMIFPEAAAASGLRINLVALYRIKSGVGKTAAAVNLAHLAASLR